MPRIRKKTSKRGTTHQREKIKHKVSEHRKKAKKQARKDKAAGKVKKKSKKDPGIPNAFPYKDEILAEIQQQRLEAAAEKQRRKAEKRAALAASKGGEDDETQSRTSQNVEGAGDIDMIGEKDGHGFDGVTSLKRQPISIPKAQQRKTSIDAETDESKVPVHRGPSTLREVLNKADVLVCVVDARDPEAGISEVLVKEAREKGKDMIIVINKTDTIPRESLVEWLGHLRKTSTTIPFRVSSEFMSTALSCDLPAKGAKAVHPMNDALGAKALWLQLENFAKRKEGDELVVAVAGVTNSGKSAMINSLFGAELLPVYSPLSSAEAAKLPYTTTMAQEVVTSIPGSENLKVRFIDTPGLEFPRQEFSDDSERHASRARDILLRCRGRIDRLKDPMFAVTHIISRAETQDLMLAYSLAAFPKGDVTAFLAGVARVNSLVKTRGVLDHAGAARIVLRDWSLGKLVRYTMPAGLNGSSTLVGDEEVLAGLRTRKELRKARDVKLVRLSAGEVDRRDVMLDQEWEEDESSDEGEDGEDGSEEGGEAGEEEENDDDEEEDDDDDDEAPPLLPAATKRKRTVSFAVVEKRRRGHAR